MTIIPHTVLGLWLYEGSRFEDEQRRFVVDVDDTPENREFLLSYKKMLLERFEQIEIYIASYPVDIL
ncbi:MAG TPA: hypothetical protein VKI65_12685 [Gemmataceae bacterium]|nr:hypothetical protein [Gemmataceae bacterium]